MIISTRLDGSKLYISPHQIEYIEETPDTVIYLVSGKKIIVRESSKEIIERLTDYWQKINSGAEIRMEDKREED